MGWVAMKTCICNKIKIVVLVLMFSIAFTAQSFAAEKAGEGANMQAAKSGWDGARPLNDDTQFKATCQNSGALYGNSYKNQPCDLTTYVSTYNTDPPGGAIFTKGLEDWWTNPDTGAYQTLKQITAQMSAFIYAQTQIMAITLDGLSFSKLAKQKQKAEYGIRNAYVPNEYGCVVSSNMPALAKSYAVSSELTQSYKDMLEKRLIDVTSTDVASYQGKDISSRWDNYCEYFQDPDANNGVSGCKDPNKKGEVLNGDIDIEGFLFRDTIDLSKKENRMAARDILINLTKNKTQSKLSKNLANTLDGRNIILKQQHLMAIRNIATDVISQIIARRAPVKQASLSGKDSGALIGEIRKNAGIPDEDIADNPSYNEIMLALTKERFLDPTYYIKVQNSLSAIQQEQTTIDAYTNIQLNDIYKMREQINTLIAAKASLNAEASLNDNKLINATDMNSNTK